VVMRQVQLHSFSQLRISIWWRRIRSNDETPGR
jgi:hypothetical protein